MLTRQNVATEKCCHGQNILKAWAINKKMPCKTSSSISTGVNFPRSPCSRLNNSCQGRLSTFWAPASRLERYFIEIGDSYGSPQSLSPHKSNLHRHIYSTRQSSDSSSSEIAMGRNAAAGLEILAKSLSVGLKSLISVASRCTPSFGQSFLLIASPTNYIKWNKNKMHFFISQ